MSSSSVVGFNYRSLEPGISAKAQDHAEAIRRLVRDATRSMIEIGKRLHEVRFLVGQRNFGAWLRAEFNWAQSVASNYMIAATKFGELDCLDRFQPSALVSLARKAVPPEVIEEAVQLARDGELVTRQKVMKIIHKHKTGTGGPDLMFVLRNCILKYASKLGANFVADKLIEIAGELRARSRDVA